MRNVFVVCMALSAALASAGCKKKAGDSADDAFAKMSGFKDSMCACKDKACADKVSADMTKWSEEMAKKNTGDKKPVTMSEADTKKYAEVTTKLGECTTKAMTAGADTMAGSAAPSGSTTPAVATVKVGEGPVVPAKTLALYDYPAFKGVPAEALWTNVEAEKDGDKFQNLMVGKDGYVSMRIIDCNSPKLKEYAAKAEDSGDFKWCFKTPAADAQKAGEYPRLDAADDAVVVIKADHLVVQMGIWGGKEDKIKKDDLAAYLATVDFKSMLATAK